MITPVENQPRAVSPAVTDSSADDSTVSGTEYNSTTFSFGSAPQKPRTQQPAASAIRPADSEFRMYSASSSRAGQRMFNPVSPDFLPGLECIAQVDALFISKENDSSGFNYGCSPTSFIIKNAQGQQLCMATQPFEADFVCSCELNYSRPFVQATDNLGKDFMLVHLEMKNCSGGCDKDCCEKPIDTLSLAVEAPVGQIAGYVHKTNTYDIMSFKIMDAHQLVVLQIEGSEDECTCNSGCTPKNLEYDIRSTDGMHLLGKLTAKSRGYGILEKFELSFPMDLDVKIKAVVLSAIWLYEIAIGQNNYTPAA